MNPASNNPGGQPPLPPSKANPKDAKSGSGSEKKNTRSKRASTTVSKLPGEIKICFAINCSAPIPTLRIRNDHSRRHAGDPDHLAEYIYCWAPYTDKNGNVRSCQYSRCADRKDEIITHLRETHHRGQLSEEQQEGYRFVTVNINHNARLHLGRRSVPSTAAMPPNFQMTQEARFHLDQSANLARNPRVPQIQQGPGLGLPPVPAFAATPAAGPALASHPLEPSLQYEGSTTIHQGYGQGQGQGYDASVGQSQGYGYVPIVGQGQQQDAGPYAAYSSASLGVGQSNDNDDDLGDIYSSNDLNNAPSGMGTATSGQTTPTTNTLNNTSWGSPDGLPRFSQHPPRFDPNDLLHQLNPQNMQHGAGSSFDGQPQMSGTSTPSLSPLVEALRRGSGTPSDGHTYPSPPQFPPFFTFTRSPADGPSRTAGRAAYQTADQTTPARGPENSAQRRDDRDGQGSPQGGHQGDSASWRQQDH